MKVLLADDSGTMRTIQKRCLVKMSVPDGNIREAENGDQAFAMFSEEPFDVVITDWNMPGMDGLELLKAIRNVNATIPVIMVTTEAERGQVLKAIQAGVTDYLVKPFTTETLKEKLERWVALEV